MTLEEYRKQAARTLPQQCMTDISLAVAGLGLTGESGEVADIIKKTIAQGHELDKLELAEELGDVLWYAAMLCTVLNISMDAVAGMNIEKLRMRYPDGFDAERSRNR